MSKKAKIEKSIDGLKSLLSILILSLFGMIAFFFINSDNLSTIKIYILSAGIAVCGVAVVAVMWIYIRYLNALEDL